MHYTMVDGEYKLALVNNFKQLIKKDKKGNNPAKLLLKVLYKHLIQLVQ